MASRIERLRLDPSEAHQEALLEALVRLGSGLDRGAFLRQVQGVPEAIQEDLWGDLCRISGRGFPSSAEFLPEVFPGMIWTASPDGDFVLAADVTWVFLLESPSGRSFEKIPVPSFRRALTGLRRHGFQGGCFWIERATRGTAGQSLVLDKLELRTRTWLSPQEIPLPRPEGYASRGPDGPWVVPSSPRPGSYGVFSAASDGRLRLRSEFELESETLEVPAVDPLQDRFYRVANRGTRTRVELWLEQLSFSGERLAARPLSPASSMALAVSPQGIPYLYPGSVPGRGLRLVSGFSSSSPALPGTNPNQILELDPESLEVKRTISSLRSSWRGVTFDAKGTLLAYSRRSVFRFDGVSWSGFRPLPELPQPQDPSPGPVSVAGSALVSLFRDQDGSLIQRRSFPDPGDAHLAFEPGDSILQIYSYRGASLRRFELASGLCLGAWIARNPSFGAPATFDLETGVGPGGQPKLFLQSQSFTGRGELWDWGLGPLDGPRIVGVGAGGDWILVSDSRGSLTRFDRGSSSPRFRLTDGPYEVGPQPQGRLGSELLLRVLGGRRERFLCLDLETGRVLDTWRTRLGRGPWTSTARVQVDQAWVVSVEGQVLRLSPGGGLERLGGSPERTLALAPALGGSFWVRLVGPRKVRFEAEPLGKELGSTEAEADLYPRVCFEPDQARVLVVHARGIQRVPCPRRVLHQE